MSAYPSEESAVSSSEAERTSQLSIIVLAAGAGTRMKSKTPKVLHPLAGRPLISHALDAAAALSPQRLAAVVRHEREKVAASIQASHPHVLLVDQSDIPGTGSAVLSALEALGKPGGTVVVTYGDVPLLSTELLEQLIHAHQDEGNAVTVLTADVSDPTGYGRIVRDENNAVLGIREHRDASEAERAITEINSGIYAFDGAALASALDRVDTNNAQGEMYLTDVLALARADGGRVAAFSTDDPWQVEGVNDRVQLAAMGKELNRRIVERWMRAGVTVQDPDSTWIESTVTLAEDVTLLANVHLRGETDIDSDAVIGPDTTLQDVQVGAGASVVRSQAADAVISAKATVGPYSYLRQGTVLGVEGKIGAFYETKNARVGDRTKLSHLGYAGDVEIGTDTNIGCGNITANYDGVRKHRTKIGSGVRTGSHTVFVAPVEVGDGVYTGAGALVLKDVPAGALTLTLQQQQIREDWVMQNRSGTVSAAAAQASFDYPSDAGAQHKLESANDQHISNEQEGTIA